MVHIIGAWKAINESTWMEVRFVEGGVKLFTIQEHGTFDQADDAIQFAIDEELIAQGMWERITWDDGKGE